jgi:RNA polymerase sigma-70 factor (ECF subfamily)
LKTNPTYYSDPELIALLKQKDEKAFSYLYEKYAAALNGLIVQVLPGYNNTENVLQKAFVVISLQIHSYDSTKCRLFTWMLNIARVTAIQYLRTNNVIDKSVQLSNPVYNDAHGMGKLIRNLPSEEKQLIGLSYFKGYSVEDLARHLGLTNESAKEKIRNALVQMKTTL